MAGCVELVTTTKPSAPPTLNPQCYVQVNTQECLKYTLDQTPEEGCACYNYCDGKYIGCGPREVFTPIDCQGELVAGCELDFELQCLLSVNTGECGALMEDFLPVSGCDCYDFCGGVYTGCCGFNQFCGFKCDGPVVSVAGCTMGGGATTGRTVDVQVPAGGFFSPHIWPEGFYPHGFDAHSRESPSVAPRDGDEIVL